MTGPENGWISLYGKPIAFVFVVISYFLSDVIGELKQIAFLGHYDNPDVGGVGFCGKVHSERRYMKPWAIKCLRSLLTSAGHVRSVPREGAPLDLIVLASGRAIVHIPVSRVHHDDRGALE